MSDQPIFEKKNVLVTGGAGFIGSFLCERLLKDGHRVICVDNLSSSHIGNIEQLLKVPDFEFIRADVAEPLDLETLPELELFKVRFQGIQEVYHLACPMSIKNFEQQRMNSLRANSLGIYRALELAAKYRAKFFLASTSVIYGPRTADHRLLREEQFGNVNHLTPRACYDEGRRWAETAAFTFAQLRGLDVRIGRLFRTYGPRLPLGDGQMVPDFILDALDGKDLVVFGDEELRTSLLYVTDAVDGIVRLMGHPTSPGVVNLGSDCDIRLVDVANKIIKLTGSASRVVFQPPLQYLTRVGLPDLSRARDELGWLPLVSLEQGLKKSIEYAITNRHLLRGGYLK